LGFERHGSWSRLESRERTFCGRVATVTERAVEVRGHACSSANRRLMRRGKPVPAHAPAGAASSWAAAQEAQGQQKRTGERLARRCPDFCLTRLRSAGSRGGEFARAMRFNMRKLLAAIVLTAAVTAFWASRADAGCGPGCHESIYGACVVDGWGTVRNECP